MHDGSKLKSLLEMHSNESDLYKKTETCGIDALLGASIDTQTTTSCFDLMTTSAQLLQIWGVCSQSQRKPRTYSPGGRSAGTITLSMILKLNLAAQNSNSSWSVCDVQAPTPNPYSPGSGAHFEFGVTTSFSGGSNCAW